MTTPQKQASTPLIDLEISPQAMDRARLLVQQATRQRDLYGHAMALARAQEPTRPAAQTYSGPAGDVVQAIGEGSENSLRETYGQLVHASHLAAGMEADDPQLRALQQAIYGSVPATDAEHRQSAGDVIDVLARDIPASDDPR